MNYDTENRIPNAQTTTTFDSSEISESTDVAIFLSKNWFLDLSEDLSYFIRHYASLITQGLFYPVFYFIYHTFFDLRISGQNNLKNLERPLLFVSNHISFYDSFIFDLFTPPFTKIPPYHFMGTTQVTTWYLKIFKYSGIMYVVYLLFGVLKVTYGQGAEKAIIPTLNVIGRGGTVAIFPEGRIWNSKKTSMDIGPFKWGAAMVALKTGVTVVPVSMRKIVRPLKRTQIIVNIGEPYLVERFDTPEEVADEMREKVIGLYGVYM